MCFVPPPHTPSFSASVRKPFSQSCPHLLLDSALEFSLGLQALDSGHLAFIYNANFTMQPVDHFIAFPEPQIDGSLGVFPSLVGEVPLVLVLTCMLAALVLKHIPMPC